MRKPLKTYRFVLICIGVLSISLCGSLWYLATQGDVGESFSEEAPPSSPPQHPVKPPVVEMGLDENGTNTQQDVLQVAPATPVLPTPSAPTPTSLEDIENAIVSPSDSPLLPRQKTREEELRELKNYIRPKEVSKENMVSIPVADSVIKKGKELKESIEGEAKDAMQETFDVIPGIAAEVEEAELGVQGDKVTIKFSMPADRVKIFGELPPEPPKKKQHVTSDDVSSDDVHAGKE